MATPPRKPFSWFAFLLWLSWGLVGGTTVWVVDGAIAAALAWLVVGAAVGWLGPLLIEQLVKLPIPFDGSEPPTESQLRSKTWSLEFTLDHLTYPPIRTWKACVFLGFGFGLINGSLFGPLAALLCMLDPNWSFSALQSAALGLLVGPLTLGLTAVVTVACCVALSRSPSVMRLLNLVHAAGREADRMHDEEVNAEHLLLAVWQESRGEAPCLVIPIEQLRFAIALRASEVGPDPTPEIDIEQYQNVDREAAMEDVRKKVEEFHATHADYFERKYKASAQSVLHNAFAEARRRKHQAIEADHVLLALTRLQDGIVPLVLRDVGIDVEQLQKDLSVKLSPPRKQG